MPFTQELPEDLAATLESYRELIGIVPPRILARFRLSGELDPELLQLTEALRAKAMNPSCFDTKTSQLMLFGILTALMSDASRLHALAARRAGATWEELHAVAGLAFLFRGLPAMNMASEVLIKLAEEEAASTRPGTA